MTAQARMRGLFTQARVATSAELFLDSLRDGARRRTSWMRAEKAGDPGPWRQQDLLNRCVWDAAALRDIVCDYVVETLGDDDAVLVIAETKFLRQGKASCGVEHQRAGATGMIANCQVGVFAAYITPHARALVDRALYLPDSWTSDQARMASARVPAKTVFMTKPAIADEMVARVIKAGVPFSWIVADAVHSADAVALRLRRAGKSYVLGVAANHCFAPLFDTLSASATSAEIGRRLKPAAWHRLPISEESVGLGRYDWAYVELADGSRADYDVEHSNPWAGGLLVRRAVASGDLGYFTTWPSVGTTLQTLVSKTGNLATAEDGFMTTKHELGLDHNDTRSWYGWRRHVSLVMMAVAKLAAARRERVECMTGTLSSVIECIRDMHDARLMIAAGLVCAVGIYTSFALAHHAARASGAVRNRWGLVSIVASGCTAWATHFIVLLAFKPGMPAAFEPILTTISLACAIVGIGAGVSIAIRVRGRPKASSAVPTTAASTRPRRTANNSPP